MNSFLLILLIQHRKQRTLTVWKFFRFFWRNCTRLPRFLSVAFMLHYIIAIQLFNATATALNCISQICCLNVALISWLVIRKVHRKTHFGRCEEWTSGKSCLPAWALCAAFWSLKPCRWRIPTPAAASVCASARRLSSSLSQAHSLGLVWKPCSRI